MTHLGWNRHQWAGDNQGTRTTIIEAETPTAKWNLSQWVGEGHGEVARPSRIAGADADGLPHGFSGFGVSDSGGQRWAPASAQATTEADAADDEEAVA
jgi:hypothetical protein